MVELAAGLELELRHLRLKSIRRPPLLDSRGVQSSHTRSGLVG